MSLLEQHSVPTLTFQWTFDSNCFMDLFAAVLYDKPIPNRHRGATIIIKRQVISELAGPCRHVYDSLLTHSTPMPYTGSYLAGTLASCHCHQRILLPHHRCRWWRANWKLRVPLGLKRNDLPCGDVLVQYDKVQDEQLLLNFEVHS